MLNTSAKREPLLAGETGGDGMYYVVDRIAESRTPEWAGNKPMRLALKMAGKVSRKPWAFDYSRSISTREHKQKCQFSAGFCTGNASVLC